MSDNFPVTPGSGRNVATDEVTYSGNTADVQLVRPVLVTGSEGSRTVVDLAGDATNGLDVDVTRLPSGTVAGSASLPAGTNNIGDVDVLTLPGVAGDVAHDSPDSGNPVKVGYKAVNHGSDPSPVAANDRTDGYANRHGVPFQICGHPNVQTVRLQFTAAQTNVAIVSASAGTKIIVTALQVTLDNASTVFPSVRIGFGTASTPTTTGVVAAHGGVPAGGGFSRGDGSGIIGIGADDEDLRITTVGAATGNGVEVVVTYYTVPA
jgi:hypothetical protein